MKKDILKKSALALAVSTAMIAPAAVADVSVIGSVRIGGLFDDGSGEDDLSISSLGSRFIMSASEPIGGGLTGIGRIEVGINPGITSGAGRLGGAGRGGGFDRTRQIWGGISGGFGTVKVGAQYSTFYSTVTGKGDIAWWGSCFLEFDCARESNVLKYEGGSGGLTYGASAELVPAGSAAGGTTEDIEEFEVGVGFNFGPAAIGAAIAVNEDGVDSGTLVGLSATGSFSGVGLSLVLQSADEEFANDTDDNTVVTVTGTYAGFYALFTSADNSATTPTNFTLGYQWNIAKKTLMYFEFQQLDADDGSDENNIIRAILKRDFTVFNKTEG